MAAERSSLELIKGVLTNRWMVVVATFFIMACSGATYNYGLYSQEMKISLGYNQETVTTIGFFKDLGANVGVFSGLIYDLTGPWVVLMFGAGFNIVGYLMIWLSVTKKVSTPAIWQMCLYICIGANSQAFTNTGVIVTSVKNFPNNRGLVIGLLKGYVGLSGAMLTLLYEAAYGNKPSSFILLIAWLPCLVCLMFMFVIRRMPPSGEDKAESEKKIFNIFLMIALVLAGFLMLIIIVQHLHGVAVPRAGFQALAAIMILIVISPLAVVVREELRKLNSIDSAQDEEKLKAEQIGAPKETSDGGIQMSATVLANGNDTRDLEHGRSASDLNHTSEDQLQPVAPSSTARRWWHWDWQRMKTVAWERPPRGHDYSIPEAVFSIDMLIIFISTTCGVGAGLMAIDNLGQIGASLGYSDQQVGTFVSLIAIWNFLGRVGSGFISEMALQRYAVPRTFFSALVMGVAAIGHVIIALNLPGALFIGSILLGLTFGAQWALMFTIISEIFGLKYYGTLYNVGGVASPLGSYLLSVRVAGSLYDREATKEKKRTLLSKIVGSRRILATGSSSELLCHGAHCYRTTFFIMAAVCIFGCLVALILTVRTREFYKGIFRKLKQQKESTKSSDAQKDAEDNRRLRLLENLSKTKIGHPTTCKEG